MKSVLERSVREDLIRRIQTLNSNSQPQWGKMNVYQMLKHCVLCEEMYLGNKKYPRKLIGRLFGRMALKSLMKGDDPLRPNSPTASDFVVKDAAGDVEAEKSRWIELITAYGNFTTDNFVHWFFGKMTKDQVGYLAYKHADHHLRQFNC